MSKKIIGRIFVGFCLVFCFLNGLSAFFFSADAETEQRELADFPVLFTENGKLNAEFDAQLSDFIAERMPFRAVALRVKSAVLDKLFASSAQDKVIIGKNGQLYFTPTVDEFCGNNLLSARAIHNLTDTLSQIDAYCRARNVRFVFTVAPNKNTLYPENMPWRYLQGDGNNYDALNRALAETTVPYVCFRDLAAQSQQPLYYATDSHWNMQGALIAYHMLMNKMELPHEDYSRVQWVEREKTGDLMKMLHPLDPPTETAFEPDYDFTYQYISRFKSEEDIKIVTHRDGGSGSLLMFRDSFGNALLPYFAEHFADAYFTRAVPCDLTLIDSLGADTVVYEIVQRNLQNVIAYAPVLPAEECRLTPNHTAEKGGAEAQVASGEMIHLYGCVDASNLTSESNIFVCLTDPAGEKQYFKSFCISEVGLLELDEPHDNGFSCRIDRALLKKNSYAVSLCVQESDGTVVEIKTDCMVQP